MRLHGTKLQAALAALVFTAGCGAGGSLPTDDNDPPPGAEQPGPAAPAATSLWPLTTGSTWTYAITDDIQGQFTKTVTVKGPSAVPGQSGVQAIQVESVQNTSPAYVELSWQQESGGMVNRVREEDRRGGSLVQTTVWSPATLKMISQLRELGWSHTQGTVTERIAMGDGSVTEAPEKPYVWTVKAVNEPVAVPAGTFPNALRVERTRSDKTDTLRTYWLVPGVGKVKETGERLEELTSYSIKP
jgi:hypothetical protein